ncbi:MAG: acetate--CoA ligase family protein [Salaquimonas sp.]|nr:acetate--CoA ligase family protein [Salaquimonas sp.]
MTASPDRLDRLLRPRSVAVIGGNWASNVVEQLQKIGFDGAIWPVHPTRDEIHGLRCYRSVADLPEAPDASFVGVNRELSINVIRELSARGAGGATCFASGFLENDETGGGALQTRLVEAAGSMPIIGPNCYGFLNYLDGVTLWPDQHGGIRCDTGVAILTQSSNIAISMTMQRRGLPIAYVVTAGNQAHTSLAEMGMALLDDARVSALGLHIEGIGDIAGFEALAAKSKALGKPIVALKVGHSEQAQAQTLTHTASLAGSEAGSKALMERLGIPAVRSITVFLETLKLLHVHGPLAGNRIASISCSGGEASLMADLAHGLRITYPPLTDEQTTGLAKALGPRVSPANPLDYHTYVWGNLEASTAVFTAMLDAPLDLALFVSDWPRADRCTAPGWDVALDSIRTASKTTGTKAAIVASMPENLPEELAIELVEEGIAPLCGMEEAILATEAAFIAGEGLRRPLPDPVLVPAALGGDGQMLDEAETKAALAAYGLRVPRSEVCVSREQAMQAAQGIGFPVVLKGLGVAHKSEAGAVAVNLRNAEALEAALGAMAGVADTFLVEEMVADPVCELIVGVVRDPAHGFVLTIGAGGVLTELMANTASLILPASRAEIVARLEALAIYRLLKGYRGKAGGDIAAVIDAVEAIAACAAAEQARLMELDVNPLIVTATGAIAVDALIRLAEPEAISNRPTKQDRGVAA